VTQPACPYTCLIEPLRDGVLLLTERAPLEKHLAQGCIMCRAEISYLDWLVTSLRAGTPVIDQLALQRERLPLLAHADQRRRHSLLPGQQGLGAIKGALAAAAVLGLAWLVFDRSPTVNVARISGSGEVRRFTEGERSIVQLDDGRYQLQVSRGVLDRSLVVRLPDGEIEDLGTAFGVTIESGHTARVDVSEGAVQLRLQGTPELVLMAGSVWEARASERGPDAPVAAESPVPSTANTPQPEAQRARGRAAKRAAKASGNTEDAMYLRVLDLLHDHRTAAARSLAQRYLQEFPHGFRRSELLRIAEPPRDDTHSE
jgi:hypothetical protein